MSQINIDVNDVHTEHKQFKNVYRKVVDASEIVFASRQRIDSRILQRRSIDYRLSQAASRLARVEAQLQAINEWIEDGLEAYIQADKRASEHPFHKKKKSIWDRIGDGLMSVGNGIAGFMEGTRSGDRNRRRTMDDGDPSDGNDIWTRLCRDSSGGSGTEHVEGRNRVLGE